MNITSFIDSVKAAYSTSELEKVTLFSAFDCQDTGTPSMYKMKPLMLSLLTGSYA